MMADPVVGAMVSIQRRLRNINSAYDGLNNPVEAMHVAQAALKEMATLRSMLPKGLQEKTWVFLSLERARPHWGSIG